MKKQKTIKWMSIALFLLVFGQYFQAKAEEPVDEGGEYIFIDEDTTWQKGDNLTFYKPVIVEPGATLTIEKGADIKLGKDSRGFDTYLIIGGGRIVALGTQDEPIKIRSLSGSDHYLLEIRHEVWPGFPEAEPSFFRYTEISGGGYAYEPSSPCPDCQAFLSHFIHTAQAFDDDGLPAVYFSGGKVHMENCRFYDNEYADIGVEYQSDADDGSYLEIVNSNFEKNDDALAVKSDTHCLWDALNCQRKVLLKNNWYDDANGPSGAMTGQISDGKEVSGIYYIDSWRKNPLIADPVIVVPGIMGSAWVNNELKLDPILHVYDNLWASFKENGYEEEKNLFDLPYDWRNSNIMTAEKLKNKIASIKDDTKVSKVDVVAHSMGGLVTRQYIENSLSQNDIDQLITLGTSHRGSPKAYLRWEAAEGFFSGVDKVIKNIFLLEAHARGYDSLLEYIHSNVISVKELLPDYAYLEKAATGEMKQYPDDYPRNEFLEVLNKSDRLEKLDKISFINIIGKTEKESTISKFRVVDSTEDGKWEHGMPENFYDETTNRGIVYGTGDETVPLSSAEGIPSDEKIEIDSTHSDLPTKAQCDVIEKLTGMTDCDYVGTFERIGGMLTFEVFSPVDIQVVEKSTGRRVGKDFLTGVTLKEIPGAYYTGTNTESEFITIPNPSDGEYQIITQGTGEGKYRIEAAKITEDETDPEKASEKTVRLEGVAETGKTEDFSVVVEGREVINPEEEKDQTPPTIEILSPENKIYRNSEKVNIKYIYNDDVSVPDKIHSEISLDENIFSSEMIDLSLLPLGKHSLKIMAEDEAKKQSEKTLEFETKTDISAIIDNVDHYYALKLIQNKKTKLFLDVKLKNIRTKMGLLFLLENHWFPWRGKEKVMLALKREINREIGALIQDIGNKKKLNGMTEMAKELLVESLGAVKL